MTTAPTSPTQHPEKQQARRTIDRASVELSLKTLQIKSEIEHIFDCFGEGC